MYKYTYVLRHADVYTSYSNVFEPTLATEPIMVCAHANECMYHEAPGHFLFDPDTLSAGTLKFLFVSLLPQMVQAILFCI